ncbi:MAG TPA: hypothetical protein DCX54_03100 [Flavobacteriales bacterium]|nr:hypothetical protein [Flavobacteriales bacterium]
MYASSCINHEIPFLQPEDKGLTALTLLEELKIAELPLVDNDKYVGLVTELDLLDYECIEGELAKIQSKLDHPSVYEDDHLFDVIGKMASEDVTILPVITLEEKYVGAIDQSSVIKMIAQAEGYHNSGGVIQLEFGIHDYSVTEISRLVESNDLKILNLYVTSSPDSNKIQVTIKLNKSELSGLIQTFDRFGYTITASFHKDSDEEDLRKRYEGFLRYLNP